MKLVLLYIFFLTSFVIKAQYYRDPFYRNNEGHMRLGLGEKDNYRYTPRKYNNNYQTPKNDVFIELPPTMSCKLPYVTKYDSLKVNKGVFLEPKTEDK